MAQTVIEIAVHMPDSTVQFVSCSPSDTFRQLTAQLAANIQQPPDSVYICQDGRRMEGDAEVSTWFAPPYSELCLEDSLSTHRLFPGRSPKNVDLRRKSRQNATFQGLRLQHVKVLNCDLRRSDLSNCTLANVSLTNSNLLGLTIGNSIDRRRHEYWGVALSPDDLCFATVGTDKCVTVWNSSSFCELQRFSGHTRKTWSVAFSLDGRRLASGSDDGTVRVWEFSRGEVCCLTGHRSSVTNVKFSPDFLVSASVDHTVQVWSVASFELIQTLNLHTILECLSFSPSYDRVAVATWNTRVEVFSTLTWENILKCVSETQLHSVTFTPDGTRLIGGGKDKKLYTWDSQTGASIAKELGHTSWIAEVAASSELACSSGVDSKILVWKGNNLIKVLTGVFTFTVESIDLTKDSRLLLSVTTGDGTIAAWKLNKLYQQ